VAERINKKGLSKVKTITVFGRTPYSDIKMSKKIKADLIVMVTWSVRIQRVYMGSNTYRVWEMPNVQCYLFSARIKPAGLKIFLFLFPIRRIHGRRLFMRN